jgi:diguanylate cyclase (GGDEF)-like protein
MNILNSFLTSGHEFSDEEYEVKYKFILLNSILAITLLLVSFLTAFIFENPRPMLTAVNTFYVIVGLILLVLLRRGKQYQKIGAFLLVITGMIVVFIDIVLYPTEYMRLIWFLIITAFAFFLEGRISGYITAVLSIVSIIVLYAFSKVDVSAYAFFLSIGFILLIVFLIDLYERRDERVKHKLYLANQHLEDKVQKEIAKRLDIYKTSNEQLQHAAEELEKQKDAYKALAHYDTLTKLPNRILFYDRLKHAINRSQRNGAKIAVLFMDLDNFKEINDSLGHQSGDIVLRELGMRLTKYIRGSDTLARFGGDEFILLMEDFENDTAISSTAQKITKIISKTLTLKGRELYLTVSIGVAIYPDDGTGAQELLKCADSAMYSAKKEGFNLVHFYKKEMTEKSLEKLTMDTYIRRGIDNDEYELYYQPQVDVSTHEIIGVEALIRWHHPQKGLVLPGDFIPIAEESALILRLGEMVLKKAAEQMARWHQKGIDPQFISVNVSAMQLRRHDIVEIIQKIVDDTCVRHDWLELEITESFTLENPKKAILLLEKIRSLGIRLSIDDFGTGYSSLSYLKNLPVDKLKIDKSFVQDIPGNRADEALVSAIVAMAKGLGINVVAEGVETEKQKDFLSLIGCNTIQGYYFAKPMPPNAIEKMLIQNQQRRKNGSTFP